MPARSFPLDPAPIQVPDEVLDDLRRRLAATKWPLDAVARPVAGAPTGITFVGYENPPGVTTGEQRVQNFLDSDREAWYHHVNITAHGRGGHFIPWEIPGEWIDDLRRTFRGRR